MTALDTERLGAQSTCETCIWQQRFQAQAIDLENAEVALRSERRKSAAAKNEARRLLSGDETSAVIAGVGDEWAARFAPKATAHRKGDSGGAKAIRKALGWGFSPEELIVCFDGVLRDDWHMGRHPKTRGRKLTGLGTILRTEDKIRGFIDLASRPISEFVAAAGSEGAAQVERLRGEVRRLVGLRELDAEMIAELVVQLRSARLVTEVATLAARLATSEWEVELEASWLAARDECVRDAEEGVRQLLPLALAAERAGLVPVGVEARAA